jgi:hypothetical protein
VEGSPECSEEKIKKGKRSQNQTPGDRGDGDSRVRTGRGRFGRFFPAKTRRGQGAEKRNKIEKRCKCRHAKRRKVVVDSAVDGVLGLDGEGSCGIMISFSVEGGNGRLECQCRIANLQCK